MSNSWFAFKQFRIEQNQCAMKVTTDACIQGAWTPILPEVYNVLDIGAGSGLLALMLAQREARLKIDAIELDEAAAAQAADNVAASSWSAHIKVVQGDIKEYQPGKMYDMIITNPPFFNNSLLSDKHNKNMARHTAGLSYRELLAAITKLLKPEGYLSILLPAAEYIVWLQQAQLDGWHEAGKLSVRHRQGAAVKRVVGLFNRNNISMLSDALTIQANDGKYTEQFKQLLSPFYLHL